MTDVTKADRAQRYRIYADACEAQAERLTKEAAAARIEADKLEAQADA